MLSALKIAAKLPASLHLKPDYFKPAVQDYSSLQYLLLFLIPILDFIASLFTSYW